MRLYCVVDVKAKGVVSIFTSLNDETAKRSFLMLLTGAESIFTEFPEDFALYSVAELVFDGGILSVYEADTENLRNAGFRGNSISVPNPISSGNDYDKRYLRMVRQDRATVDDIVNDEEVSE